MWNYDLNTKVLIQTKVLSVPWPQLNWDGLGRVGPESCGIHTGLPWMVKLSWTTCYFENSNWCLIDFFQAGSKKPFLIALTISAFSLCVIVIVCICMVRVWPRNYECRPSVFSCCLVVLKGAVSLCSSRTPAMIGCSFVVDREYFGEIGLLDPGMEVYGGENIELGMRVRTTANCYQSCWKWF